MQGVGGGGAEKKGKAFEKPLCIPQKSNSKSEDDDGDNDRFTFGRVIGMMMMQNHLDNEQRERQYKSEKEQRDREYEL